MGRIIIAGIALSEGAAFVVATMLAIPFLIVMAAVAIGRVLYLEHRDPR